MKNNWRGEFRGFWLGRAWVSECRNCGHICLTVADEETHRKIECVTNQNIDHDKASQKLSDDPCINP